jgi:hypothetical protein
MRRAFRHRFSCGSVEHANGRLPDVVAVGTVPFDERDDGRSGTRYLPLLYPSVAPMGRNSTNAAMTANPQQLKECINYKEFRGTAFVQARFQQTLVPFKKRTQQGSPAALLFE